MILHTLGGARVCSRGQAGRWAYPPCVLGSVWSSPPSIAVSAFGYICIRSDVGQGGVGEHSAECLRCGVRVRLVAQLAEPSDPCPRELFEDRSFVADSAAF